VLLKTGFEIQSYIPRTHEMKNRILSKNRGCLFFVLPKIYQLPEYYMLFAWKYFFSQIWGGNCPFPFPASPRPMSDNGKECHAAWGVKAGGCSSPFLRPWARRWFTTYVCDAWPVQRQTYGYLPSMETVSSLRVEYEDWKIVYNFSRLTDGHFWITAMKWQSSCP